MKMYDIESFDKGLWLGVDSTKAPIGSAQIMNNTLISERGGLSKRPGTELLGTLSTTAAGCTGLYNFKKSDGTIQIPVRAYSTYLQYFSPQSLDWEILEGSFTSGSEWGFKESLVNTENTDYLYFGNQTENYRRWSGATTLLNGALVGAETTVTVDSVLYTDVFYSGTATSVTTTAIDVAGTPWATDQWNTSYVYITSGAQSGTISLISDTDSNTITFATITGLSGTPTFEIRKAKFPATGTLVIAGTEVAYTAIPTATTFTVGSAPASADNSAVTVKPTSYAGNPKGNIFESHLGRIIVGNALSATSRDSSGNLQGSFSPASYYVSKLTDNTSFAFASTRVAGEGVVASLPYGGGNITDIVDQEETFYVFKKDYIESGYFTQDQNDTLYQTPIKQGVGSIYRTIKGKDDVYFVTPRNEITTIGRTVAKDILPQTANIGTPISRYLDDCLFDKVRGIEFKDRIYFTHKDSSSSAYNDRFLVYNKSTQSFEGIWLLPAFGFFEYNSNLYYGDSKTPNVYKMLVGTDDIQDTSHFGITAEWKSNFFSLAPSDMDLQEVSAYAVEGWIKGDTSIDFSLYADFADDPSLTFTFTGSETGLITADSFSAYLGDDPLGISPESSIGSADENGFRHFKFVVYFPFIHGNHFAIGVENSGTGQAFDITRISLGIESDNLKESTSVKSL